MAIGPGFGGFMTGFWGGASSVAQLAHELQQYKIGQMDLESSQRWLAANQGQGQDQGQDQGQGQGDGRGGLPAVTLAPAQAQPDQTQTQAPPPDDNSAQGEGTKPAVPKAPTATAKGGVPAGMGDRERQAYNQGFVDAHTNAATGATNPLVGMGDRERQAYDQPGPGRVASPAMLPHAGLPGAPTMTAPSNMPTFDVPMSQPGAVSSGQGTPQGTAAQTGPPPAPGGLLPNMSQPMTNAPIGATIQNWRAQPGQAVPLPPSTQGLRAPGQTPIAPSTTPSTTPPTGPFGPTSQAQPQNTGILAAIQQGRENARTAMAQQPPTGTMTAQAGPPGAATGQAAARAQAAAIGQALADARRTGAPVMVPGTTIRANPDGTTDDASGTGGTGAPPPATTGKEAGVEAARHPVAAVATGQVSPPSRAAPAAPPPAGRTQVGPTVAYQPPEGASGGHPTFEPWHTVQSRNPDMVAAIRRAVDDPQVGGGYGVATTYEAVAAHLARESGAGFSGKFLVNHESGAEGVMQVLPNTWQGLARAMSIDPNDPKFDVRTTQGGINRGVLYLRYLAQDMKLGANTYQQDLAYMMGPNAIAHLRAEGWDAFRKSSKTAAEDAGYLEKMYPDMQGKFDTANFPGGYGEGKLPATHTRELMQAASTGDPRQLLSVVASGAAPGMGMTGAWQQAQTWAIASALAHGRGDTIPAIVQGFWSLTHQGALADITDGYAAYKGGNMELAAQLFARSHAFIPDGAAIRIGVSKDSSMHGEMIDERTQESIGKPFNIDEPAIMEAYARISAPPGQWASNVLKMRQENAEIGRLNAQADYFRARPEEAAARLAEKTQRDEAMADEKNRELDLKAQIADLKAQGQGSEDTLRHTIGNAEATHYGNVDQLPYAGELDQKDANLPARLNTAADTSAALQLPTRLGGQDMNVGEARNWGDKIARGQAFIATSKDGKARGVYNADKWDTGANQPKTDKDGKPVDPDITFGLRGGVRVAQPPPPEQRAELQNRGINAGAGSPMAAMMGGSTLAGNPQMGIPVAQRNPDEERPRMVA